MTKDVLSKVGNSDEPQDHADHLKASFDWVAFMNYIMNTPKSRGKVGPAWLLLFDIYLHADLSGVYRSTYRNLSQTYGVSPITIKKWRQHLCKESVIESFSRGHGVVFKLTDTFRAFLKPQLVKQSKNLEKHLLQMLLRSI